MKKLLCSAGLVGLAFAATPAHAADGLKLDVGGYFKGYTFYTSQDDAPGADSRNIDIIRNTEIHLGGETTLDNGLTVGFHTEVDADGSDTGASNDSFDVNESYAYFSGGWGRVNFGSEDGAAYLLQVEAPSADENIDGLRQFVNPVNYAAMDPSLVLPTLLDVSGSGSAGGLDYDQDVSGNSDKITYLSPIMNGFQVGASYDPDVGGAANENALNQDNQAGFFGSAFDFGARYESQFNNVGVVVGGGYSHVNLEKEQTLASLVPGALSPRGDVDAWNGGVDLTMGPFGLGVAYTNTDYGDVHQVNGAGTAFTDVSDNEKIWDVGADYTTGPFKVGVSYYNNHNVLSVSDLDAQRYTGGVTYTYGPGMTFRGSVSHLNLDGVNAVTGGKDSPDATSVVLGTQINF